MLNPVLFNCLKNRFGEVRIAAENEPIDWELVAGPRNFRKIRRSGEEYRVSCPVCGDTRFRLYVNHRWGVYDPESNSRNLHLIRCWNLECFRDYQRRDSFFRTVLLGHADAIRLAPVSSRKATWKVSEVSWPEQTVELSELGWDHPALEYLRGRKFQPGVIADWYGVRYCQARSGIFSGRLVIPIYSNGAMVSYQARKIVEDGRKGDKYMTCKGAPIRGLLYNFDRAKNYPTLVLVEGPTDAWRLGSCSAALLGKELSAPKLEALVSASRAAVKTVVVMLDPSGYDPSKTRKEHHIVEAANALRRAIGPDRVVEVWLPDGRDPGNSSRDFLVKAIVAASRRNNVFVKLPGKAEHAF